MNTNLKQQLPPKSGVPMVFVGDHLIQLCDLFDVKSYGKSKYGKTKTSSMYGVSFRGICGKCV